MTVVAYVPAMGHGVPLADVLGETPADVVTALNEDADHNGVLSIDGHLWVETSTGGYIRWDAIVSLRGSL